MKLPPFWADKGWGAQRHTALYPTARLSRQPTPGDWP